MRALITSVQDNYLDAYLRVIKQTDPLSTALVFNCGMGAVRTTFAMVAACIVRRKQVIDNGLEDPYAARSVGSKSGLSTVGVASSITVQFSLNCHHSPPVDRKLSVQTSPQVQKCY